MGMESTREEVVVVDRTPQARCTTIHDFAMPCPTTGEIQGLDASYLVARGRKMASEPLGFSTLARARDGGNTRSGRWLARRLSGLQSMYSLDVTVRIPPLAVAEIQDCPLHGLGWLHNSRAACAMRVEPDAFEAHPARSSN